MGSRKFDGKRGYFNKPGYWISLEEAQDRVGNVEWWRNINIPRKVPTHQQDPKGPKDRPVWCYAKGSLYLGQWKYCKKKRRPVEHGFGAFYVNHPDFVRGKVYIGDFKDGYSHGHGAAVWFKGSQIWKENRGPDGKTPYDYIGEFRYNHEKDPKGTSIWKDGTKRVGPWKDGKPVGNVFNDHADPCEISDEDSDEEPRHNAAVSGRASKNSRQVRGAKRKRTVSRQSSAKKQTLRRSDRIKVPVFQFGAVEHSKRKHDEEEEEADVVEEEEEEQEEEELDEEEQEDEEEEQQQVVAQPHHQDDRSPATSRTFYFQELRQWLITKIGLPCEDADEYATKLVDLGLSSVTMIRELCMEEDVLAFHWMKPFHKRALIRFGKLRRSAVEVPIKLEDLDE
jgi:hypothetical protein